MKTSTTKTNGERLPSHPEQGFKALAQLNKYIVLQWRGREQVTVFPFSMRHADVFGYMKRECPELKAVSAGFFLVDECSVWCAGNSESLNLASRPDDARAIEKFFESPDRQLWDLLRLSQDARNAADMIIAHNGCC